MFLQLLLLLLLLMVLWLENFGFSPPPPRHSWLVSALPQFNCSVQMTEVREQNGGKHKAKNVYIMEIKLTSVG